MRKYLRCMVVLMIGGLGVLNAFGVLNLELTSASTSAISIRVESDGTNSQEKEILGIMSKDLSHTNKIGLKKKHEDAEYKLALHTQQDQICLNIAIPQQSFQQGKTICVHKQIGHIRSLAHFFADKVYQHILGKPSIYTRKLAFVTERKAKDGKRLYKLMLADYDGMGAQTLVQSHEPITSPSFSRDGQQLVYVSYESGVSKIFMQNLQSGQRRIISSELGLNSAPSFSPDGKKIAMVLSPHGQAKIFIYDIKLGTKKGLYEESAIQTDPVWQKDGKHIVFTSSRHGGPQIYRVNIQSKALRRLTAVGFYNVSPSISSDNRYMAYLTRIDSKLQAVIMDFKEQNLLWLGSGILDDTPRLSQKGQFLVYSNRRGSNSALSIMSIDRSFFYQVKQKGVHYKYPAWYPGE
jgi:TolB protein